MLRIFIGYDSRQPVSYNALQFSILKNASKAVAITPLCIETLPIKRTGLTPFTFSRFLVPYLCDYEGWALFLDIDMLVRGDIAELFNYKNDDYAVMVSKNDHRFEWASAMLFNCAKCTVLSPAYVQTASGLHTIDWAKPEEIGDFPREWNHLVGYDEPRDDAKLIHYTQGVPAFDEIGDCEYSQVWRQTVYEMARTLPWADLMATSVHATDYQGKRISKLLAKKLDKLTSQPQDAKN